MTTLYWLGSGIDAETRAERQECYGDECGYGDLVDVAYDDFGYGSWDCPRCGEENRVDPPEPDPDEAYDRWRDNRGESA